jgi:hypothetical protein
LLGFVLNTFVGICWDLLGFVGNCWELLGFVGNCPNLDLTPNIGECFEDRSTINMILEKLRRVLQMLGRLVFNHASYKRPDLAEPPSSNMSETRHVNDDTFFSGVIFRSCNLQAPLFSFSDDA